MSALQILTRFQRGFPGSEPAAADLRYLRNRVEAIEEMNDQARQALVKYEGGRREHDRPRFESGPFGKGWSPTLRRCAWEGLITSAGSIQRSRWRDWRLANRCLQ